MHWGAVKLQKLQLREGSVVSGFQETSTLVNEKQPMAKKRNKIIALAGQPNMGKSTLFNLLTGLNQHVGNWPGKTVEQRSGVFTFDGNRYDLIDLPGTYSLTANSPEEVIAREYIIGEEPDVVIAVVNAANLERSLYLVSELVCLPVPVVVALNMMDVAKQEGVNVDVSALSKELNLPVIPIIATKALGVRELLSITVKVIEEHDNIEEPNTPEVHGDVTKAIEEIQAIINEYVPKRYCFFGRDHRADRYNLPMVTEGEDINRNPSRHHGRLKHRMINSFAHGQEAIQGTRSDSPSTNVGEEWHNHRWNNHQIDERGKFVTYWVALKLLEGDSEITRIMQTAMPTEAWNRVQQVLHRNEDAMVAVASSRYNWIGGVIHKSVDRPKLGQIGLTERLDRVATHPFWGLVLLILILGFVFWLTFIIGAPAQEWLDTNLVVRSANMVKHAMQTEPVWLSGLIADGIINGVGSVLTFLPIIIIFFAAFGFLEDIGYMARAAYVMDNVMHLMGLHGKSFLPLFLGFGCNVPAVMGTRVIDSWQARLLTILIAPMVPCTARMAVIAFIAPAFFGKNALFVTWGMVVLSLVLMILLGVLLNKLIFKGERSAFIMEMPLYHIPNLRTIGLLVWQRSLSFIKKAGTVILGISAVIWALSYFPGGDLNSSYMAQFGRFIEPAGRLIGFDWRLSVALITTFPAKENAIATLGVLFGGVSDSGLTQTLAATYSTASALSFLVVSLLFIPCMATISVIKQETESWKWPLLTILIYLILSLSMGALTYHLAKLIGV